MNQLESEIEHVKYLVDLCIDALFKSHDDLMFQKIMRNMGFSRLLSIAISSTLGQNTACYNRICFSRMAKIIRFKKDILEFVTADLTILHCKVGQIASFYSAFNKDN